MTRRPICDRDTSVPSRRSKRSGTAASKGPGWASPNKDVKKPPRNFRYPSRAKSLILLDISLSHDPIHSSRLRNHQEIGPDHKNCFTNEARVYHSVGHEPATVNHDISEYVGKNRERIEETAHSGRLRQDVGSRGPLSRLPRRPHHPRPARHRDHRLRRPCQAEGRPQGGVHGSEVVVLPVPSRLECRQQG